MVRGEENVTKPVELIWPAIFFTHLAVHRCFRLPNLKFGLPFGHWQATISSPAHIFITEQVERICLNIKTFFLR